MFAPSPPQALTWKRRAGQPFTEAVDFSVSRKEVFRLLSYFRGAQRQSRQINPGFQQERLAETMEGMADFAGLQPLWTISLKKY